MSDETLRTIQNKSQDIGQLLYLPYKNDISKPKSDALDDVHLRFNELVNFIGEVLLSSQMTRGLENFVTFQDVQVQLDMKHQESAKFPIIKIKDDESKKLTKNIARKLFYSSIVQLATIYEVFLSELIREILVHNDEWLESHERPFTAKEIFQIGTIDEIRRKLMSEKILDYAMLSYPKKVKKFEKDFHVGLHQKNFPLSLFEVHDFLEVRNVIVHNDGHASEHYVERMSFYNQKTLIKGRYSTLEIDFSWLLTFGQTLLSQCVMVDESIDKKWKTSRNT